jgi:hypothetical protein
VVELELVEEWRVVSDWPDYEVSNFGRVRKATDGLNGTGGVIYPKGHIRKLYRHKGHHWVGLTRDRTTKTRGVAPLVCAAFHGPKPSWRHEALHNNGDGYDDRADNLRWGTRLENQNDKDRHGRTPKGSKHWRSRLTEDQVLEIKRDLATGILQGAELARKYGVPPQTISNIKNGLCWRWLTP